MCYYNGIRVSKDDRIRLLEIEKDLRKFELNRPMQSGFDYDTWPVIKPVAGCKDWEIVLAHWEFIPPWVSSLEELKMIREGIDPKTGARKAPVPWLNATGENLLTSRMFRDAALHRRCLVLSSGFYEWRHIHPLSKKGQPLKTTLRYPYHITLKDQPYFFIAGIWTPWTDRSTGETFDTFALVTTAANDLMEQIHNSKKRMPAILTEALAAEWISEGLSEERITEIATSQVPANMMQAYSIRKDFREAPDPAEAFRYEELPELALS